MIAATWQAPGRARTPSPTHTANPYFERGAGPGTAGRPAAAPGAVHPVDAGDPPVQALHRLAAVLRRGRVLPHLCHRRRTGALTRRACAPSLSARQVADSRVHSSAVRGPADRGPSVRQSLRLRARGHARAAGPADLRGHRGRHHRPRRRARPPGVACVRQRTKVVLVPLPPAIGRAIDRAIGDRLGGAILLNSRDARMDRPAATRRLRHLPEAAGVRITRPHPRMLRHTFVTTMLDAGVDVRDVQIAARHADPRTTMRHDRARKNLDRHPNYILAAYMASGTWPSPAPTAQTPGDARHCR
jgi:Phage integrase family